jgi:hypothetical protein
LSERQRLTHLNDSDTLHVGATMLIALSFLDVHAQTLGRLQ